MEHCLEARLLLVDDDPEAIRMLSGMLPDYANQRFATSGKDALRLARAETPDLILLDIEMPDTDGFEVCRRLKGDRRLADVPVIFVTNHGGPASEAACRSGRGRPDRQAGGAARAARPRGHAP